MGRKRQQRTARQRRYYEDDFKQEAVEVLLDGHSADSGDQNKHSHCPKIDAPQTIPVFKRENQNQDIDHSCCWGWLERIPSPMYLIVNVRGVSPFGRRCISRKSINAGADQAMNGRHHPRWREAARLALQVKLATTNEMSL